MNILYSIILVCSLVLSGCTISHDYGPYKGKVVDKETNEPIEGAVVFLRFFTEFQFSPGGPVAKYVDAVEVMTDENGEFIVPRRKIQETRFLHAWDTYGHVIIFKPGYGAYPRHREVSPRFKPSGTLPEDEYVFVGLPKLKTTEERKKNLGHIAFENNVPHEKWRNLFNYRNIENIEVGLTPYKDPLRNTK